MTDITPLDWEQELLSKNARDWLEDKAKSHPECANHIITRINSFLSNAWLDEDKKTVHWLWQKSEAELLRNPNFGRKSLKTIKDFLQEDGLLLYGGRIPDEQGEALNQMKRWWNKATPGQRKAFLRWANP